MKKIFFFTIAFFCVVLSSAQNKSRTIHIDVIYPIIVKDTISIEYQHNGWSLRALETIKLEDSLSNNHFEIYPENEEKFFYLNLRGKNRYLLVNYIAEPGDSIQVYIEPEKVMFRGRGSEKYQCRYDMDRISKIFPYPNTGSKYNSVGGELVKDSLYYTNYIPDAHSSLKRIYASSKCSQEVLNWYKSQLSNKVYNVLMGNLLAETENKIWSSFTRMYNGFNSNSDDTQKRNIRDSLTNIYRNREACDFSRIPDSLLAYSQEYLYYLSSLYLRKTDGFAESLAMHRDPILTKNGSQEIEQKFNGILRDRAVTQYLIRGFSDLPKVSDQIERTLSFIKDPDCRSLLFSLKNTNSEGSKAFAFQLPDFNNRTRSLKEFKGKLILMDYWFTGCSGCMVMAKNLKPVAEYFKNNKNVVFISISADEDFSTWKSSVKEGIYTNKYSIDLFTQGKGTDHPIIKNFKVMKYPTLIMIGKDGKVITTAVIKPYNEKDQKKLISFIEQNI
ncbi:peroxiredoxin [Pedobacter africanus]|uniref:Peroxiredoxin n=1 Tax=Pedobacter africanus TaxID=151894 RepID=A0ACC6KVA8_9SPHI|nr:thioredoxin family protein [Pedobacter africanus]MDR6783310.1 peroxiredoxin [Pedobacter africanus]